MSSRGRLPLRTLAVAWVLFANTAPTPALSGDELLPWLRSEIDVSPRVAVVGARASNQGNRRYFYMREGPMKWIGQRNGPGSLYDLRRDPGESDPEDSVEMLSRLTEIAAASETDGVAPAERPDPEVLRAPRALGYAD